MNLTVTQIQEVLDARFGGLLRKGSHAENGVACALEALSAVQGIPWTDNPKINGTWDLRSLNDIEVPDEIRTNRLVPVLAAYAGCRNWESERQIEVATALVIGTVRTLIADLPSLPTEIAARCRDVNTLTDAADAAHAADAAADAARAAHAARIAAHAAAAAHASAYDAARDAHAAAHAADAAAHAADDDAHTRETVFITACQVWMDALQCESR